MKKSIFKVCSTFLVLLGLLVSNQVFSDIIIRKDNSNPTNQPNNVTMMKSLSKTVQTAIPVSAEVDGTNLTVYFDSNVGTAIVSVVDQSGAVVYVTTVDTFGTPEVVIPLNGLSSGSYSSKISYGSTKLIGDFQF